jgi:serine/threonine protein kinase
MHSGAAPQDSRSPLISRLQEQIGATLRVLDLIGTRGPELLLHARDTEHDADVVIRVLPIDDTLLPGALESFEQEVAIASALEHPAIVSVSMLQRRDGLAFCVERGRAAPSLESKMREGHGFSLEEARSIVSDVALALDHAHARDVVHGALVPALIFLRENGGARVAGFGEGGPSRPSRRSESPAYTAPEQWQHEGKADARTDVYALGVIAFELIAGQRRTISSSTAGITTIDPLALTPAVPLHPAAGRNVNTAILRATSKQPSRRFATAQEFSSMLETIQPTASSESPTQPPSLRVPARARFSVPLGAIVAVVGTVIGILVVPLARRLHASRISLSSFTQPIDLRALPDPVLSLSHESASSSRESTTPMPSELPATSEAASITSESADGVLSAQSDASGFGVIDVEFEGGPTTVMVDGIPRGETPFHYRATVGEHKIKLVGLPATDPSDRTVRVHGGDTVLASFRIPR